MSDSLGLIGRWECPEHGGDLGGEHAAEPDAWCPQQHGWVKAEWIEYVPAEQLRGAVADRDRYKAALETICAPDEIPWSAPAMWKVAKRALDDVDLAHLRGQS